MDTMQILEVLANILVLAGVLVFAVAAVGLFKFSDVYTRISAVGTAAGLGISLVVIGVFVLAPSWSNFILLLLIIFLQLATSSVGTMAIARSAYLTGSKMQPGYFDHLAEDQGEPETEVSPDHDVVDEADDGATNRS
jgi:multicomponent Na+:H+ antiporter subunit G